MFNPIVEIKRRVALPQIAKFVSRVERAPITRTPSEAGLKFADVTFTTDDNVTLKAWYIPAEGSKKLVICNHFMLANRSGAAPNPDWGNITIDFIPIYKALVEAGYSVLTYDLRNHGESDLYKDGMLGQTHTEYRDVLASIRYAKAHYPDSEIYLFSQCYGTVATIRAMEKSPEDFEDIKAFVNLQPLSLDAFIEGMSEKYGFSHPGNVSLFSRHLKKRTGISAEECRVEDIAYAVSMPTLLVQVRNDWRTTNKSIEAIHDRISSTDKTLYWIENESERLEGYNYFARNPQKLIDWLNAR